MATLPTVWRQELRSADLVTVPPPTALSHWPEDQRCLEENTEATQQHESYGTCTEAPDNGHDVTRMKTVVCFKGESGGVRKTAA